MIVTSTRQTTKGKPGYLHKGGRAAYAGYAYEGLKVTSKALGFYQDIKPYLPETYLDKYRYKPGKRVAGYIGQKLHKSKVKTSNYKFRKTCSGRVLHSGHYSSTKNISQSSYCS